MKQLDLDFSQYIIKKIRLKNQEHFEANKKDSQTNASWFMKLLRGEG
jgi:hypothetical protein